MNPSWDLYAAFLSVVRTGSLSAASRALGVAQPTVRRQVEAFEESLGLVLFTRSQAGLSPTEAAMAMLPYAEAMAGNAEAAMRAVHGSTTEVGGTVRITASEMIGLEVLPRMVGSLIGAHPRLAIEISATNANEDLVRRDADIAIRLNAPTQGALVPRRAGTVAIGFYASSAYVAARGMPRSTAELKRHTLVGRDRDVDFYAALEAAGLSLARSDFAYRTDSDVGQLAAVRAGIGIGACQLPLAGDLVRVLPKLSFALPVWVVTHEDLRHTRRVAEVFEHLVRELTAYCG